MFDKLWDILAPVYDKIIKKDEKAYEEIYGLIREKLDRKDVLEIGTGTGIIAVNVASKAKAYIGTDFSKEMIKQARKKEKTKNLSFEVVNAENLLYEDNSFDVVIISNSLHIMSNPNKVLKETSRVLKKDGLLIAPNFLAKKESKNKILNSLIKLVIEDNKKFSEDSYRELLSTNGWEIKKCKIIESSFPIMYVECKSISK